MNMTQRLSGPARNLAPLFEGGGAIGRLWLFWAAPFLGALAAGFVYEFVGGVGNPEPVPVVGDN